MTYWGEVAKDKAEADALSIAEERLCKNCTRYTTLRTSFVIACGPQGSSTYERSHQLAVPACRFTLLPLTSTGEDCPYFEQAALAAAAPPTTGEGA